MDNQAKVLLAEFELEREVFLALFDNALEYLSRATVGVLKSCNVHASLRVRLENMASIEAAFSDWGLDLLSTIGLYELNLGGKETPRVYLTPVHGFVQRPDEEVPAVVESWKRAITLLCEHIRAFDPSKYVGYSVHRHLNDGVPSKMFYPHVRAMVADALHEWASSPDALAL